MAVVLVTGGTGFIGRHTLAPLVSAGHQVHITGSRPIDSPPGVSTHRVDLLDRPAIGALCAELKAERLIHLAWALEPGKYVSSFTNAAWVAATLELLSVFASNGGRRAVLAGTCFEYDFSVPVMHETRTPTRPDTVYGEYKNELRESVASWSASSGVPCAWGRVFYLYGPYEDRRRLVASVILALLNGQDAPCSQGLQVRDFLHVQDVADAFVALLHCEYDGTVNIASSTSTTVREVVETIAEFTGNAHLVRFGAYPTRAGDPLSVLGDNTLLRSITSWFPQHDLRSGIRETVNWWSAQQEVHL